jgi:hypothetical protein
MSAPRSPRRKRFALAQFGGSLLSDLQHVVDSRLDPDKVERLADEVLCAGLQSARL